MTDAMKEMTEQPKVTRVDFAIGEQRFAFYPSVGIIPVQVIEISPELNEQLQQLSEIVKEFAKNPALAAEVTRLTKELADAMAKVETATDALQEIENLPAWTSDSAEQIKYHTIARDALDTLTASEKPKEASKV